MYPDFESLQLRTPFEYGAEFRIESTLGLVLSDALFNFALDPQGILLKRKYGISYWVVIRVDYVLCSVLAPYIVL